MNWWRKRRARRAERRIAQMRAAASGADRTFTIVPPEGVPLSFRLAPMSSRFGAQLLDLAITFAVVLAVFLALIFSFDLDSDTLIAILSLVAFLARTPYYVIAELVWNGRTITKSWLGLRTISRDGRSLRPYQIVVRNLLREIEFFAPILYASFAGGWASLIALAWMAVVVIVPWRSKRNQRLGDMIAGTVVIEEPKAVLLGDVTQGAVVADRADERFSFSTAQLDAYGAYELQVLERLLRPPPDGRASAAIEQQREATLLDVADRIRRKIGYEERVEPRETLAFLQAFYRAERAYLESRKLFGDARADKTYREREREDV